MRWPWKQQAKPVEPRPMVSIRAMELETAKEILAEVFHARPGEVGEMIKSREIALVGLDMLIHELYQ
jgi:hypothetical protein